MLKLRSVGFDSAALLEEPLDEVDPAELPLPPELEADPPDEPEVDPPDELELDPDEPDEPEVFEVLAELLPLFALDADDPDFFVELLAVLPDPC